MRKPEPEARRSSGAPPSPSPCASMARRTRTWTSEGLSRSARPFMKSLSRAMSAGGAAPGLSFQSGASAAPAVDAIKSQTADETVSRHRALPTRIRTPPGRAIRSGRIGARTGRQYTARSTAEPLERPAELARVVDRRQAAIAHAEGEAGGARPRPAHEGDGAEGGQRGRGEGAGARMAGGAAHEGLGRPVVEPLGGQRESGAGGRAEGAAGERRHRALGVTAVVGTPHLIGELG